MARSHSEIKGAGEKRIKELRENGIRTALDLVLTAPSKYRDLTNIKNICDAAAGEECAVCVRVVSPATQAYAKRLMITKTVVSDGTGEMNVVWYNQPWMKGNLFVGRELLLMGRCEQKGSRLQMSCPSIETERGIIPVYRAIGSIAPKTVRQLILSALDLFSEDEIDPLPESIRREYGLMGLYEAVRAIHLPKSHEALDKAMYRFAFENLLLFQIAVGLMRNASALGVQIDCGNMDSYCRALAFPLTGAQKRVLAEIREDMASSAPMARLVQGDVGSGKTAVAFGAIYLAAKAGWQSAMMAPTEILAVQHYESAKKILAPLGIEIGLLTGSSTQKQHAAARENLASGKWQAVFGTHALITENVAYQKLGLVITDEQHRFGVRQRTLLGEKGDHPNVLVMSATPIPRTLSLILFGDLDISVIDELPPGRKSVKTRIVPENKRQDMYGFIRREVKAGRQVYFVCPLVEDSEAIEAQSAEILYDTLKNDVFADLSVCLVHGKQKPKEKEEAIEAFRTGQTDVMVSTTVIEVGVNVPNASVMVIENAERFGLAQLHQLRGRVGRGMDEAWCFLMAKSNQRLKTLTETNDGFIIAKKDMEIRGPGEIFGTRQSGAVMEGAFGAHADGRLLGITHELAREIIKNSGTDEDAKRTVALAKEWLSKRESVITAAN
ncbi:MAG: ATP-dependent DNA helicase RecG [Clostridia bacterium]|nr:ATP-dependent DNA helicase RecG [Clostridia bacterium]